MAGNWNPNHPAAVGLEWLVDRDFTASVTPGERAIAQVLRSTAAEAVTGFRMRASGVSSSLPLFTLVEVIPLASLVVGPRLTAQMAPNADLSIGTWVRSDGATTNLFSFIDDPPTLTPSAYIRQSTTGTSAYRCHLSDANIPAGVRVLKVAVKAVIGAQANPTVATRAFAFRIEWVPTGDLYTAPGSDFTVGIFGALAEVSLGEVNPRTQVPWTRADLAQFNGGNWALRVEAVGSPTTWARMDALALEVDYAATENRVAVGTWARPSGSIPAWVSTANLVTLATGAAGWAKPGSGDFVYLWRAANNPYHTGGGPRADDVRWLGAYSALSPSGGNVVPPVPGMTAQYVDVDGYGLITNQYGYGAAVMGLVLAKSGPTYSDDSQPYELLTTGRLTVVPGTDVAQRVRQTSGASQNYLGLRFVIAPPDTGTSTLTVSVWQVGGGQVGGTLVIDAATARALPVASSAAPAPTAGWRLIEGFLSSGANLANNTQYEVRFTVSGSGNWVLPAPDATTWASASYRGTTDSARQGGSTLTTRDVPVVLLIQPSAPTLVAAKTTRWEVQRPTGCDRGVVDQAVLTWAPTTLGGSFARYEIDRLDQAGVWQRIREPTVEATSSILDLEAPRNRPSKYRIRVVATTNAFSSWVETEFVTPEQDGPGVLLASNAAPELTVFVDHDPSVPFDFPDHDTDESYLPYGADGRVVFFDPEDRGVTKRYRLTVNFADIPHDESGNLTGDDAIWEPLRRITRSTAVPYVAVLDGFGNVNYAHVALSNGERDQPGDRYYVDATIVPVQFIPTAVD